MKRFMLFAGDNNNTNAVGVHGLVGDFDSVAEAFMSLVDNQTPSVWWHVLDSQTGEVHDRQNLQINGNGLTFGDTTWNVARGASLPVVPAATKPLNDLEDGLRVVVESSLKNGNGHANTFENSQFGR